MYLDRSTIPPAGRGLYTPHGSTGPHRTGPHRFRGSRITPSTGLPAQQRDGDLLRAAFRDLHGARLHGFALIVSLGDRRRAAAAAADALEHGARRAGDLRHPERAAAWLRAHVVRRLRRSSSRGGPPETERRAALGELGAADPVFDGLAALPFPLRAALVAAAIERFSPIDVETILGLPAGSSRRAVARARARYLATVAAVIPTQAFGASPRGELADRIRAVAGRTMGTVEAASR